MTDPLRVAVVGAGPAGCYVADSLCFDRTRAVAVDLFDRLPTPFGLLRYGVAPDHLKMKRLQGALERILDDPRVRFLGNVTVGTDVTVDELRRSYHAVVYSHGAPIDRRLGIEGEDLPGSSSATDLVSWYSGHPDGSPSAYGLHEPAVAVVGMGNVAIDVARILLKDADQLRQTDIPTDVLNALAASRVRDVHLVGRRGPGHARWTSKELKELGELPGVDIRVDPSELELDAETRAVVDADADLRRCVELLSRWSDRSLSGRERRLHLHFNATPVSILGRAVVEGLRVQRTGGTPDDVRTLPVQAVFRAVGYLGRPLPGLPFDDARAVVPSCGSRVDRGPETEPGEYVCGWIRRGARGVLGTNRSDADDCVTTLLDDEPRLRSRVVETERVTARLVRSGAIVVDAHGWKRIDAAERAWGAAEDRPRAKIPTADQLLRAAGVAAALPDGPAPAAARAALSTLTNQTPLDNVT